MRRYHHQENSDENDRETQAAKLPRRVRARLQNTAAQETAQNAMAALRGLALQPRFSLIGDDREERADADRGDFEGPANIDTDNKKKV